MPLSKKQKELRDFVIYVLAGLLWAGAALAEAAYLPPSSRIDVKWLGFAGATLVSFGYAIHALIKLRLSRNRHVWLSLSFMLLIHLTVFILVLRNVDRVPLIYFGFLPAIQIPIIVSVLSWIVKMYSKAKNGAHNQE